jgi:hypothetical protein
MLLFTLRTIQSITVFIPIEETNNFPWAYEKTGPFLSVIYHVIRPDIWITYTYRYLVFIFLIPLTLTTTILLIQMNSESKMSDFEIANRKRTSRLYWYISIGMNIGTIYLEIPFIVALAKFVRDSWRQ